MAVILYYVAEMFSLGIYNVADMHGSFLMSSSNLKMAALHFSYVADVFCQTLPVSQVYINHR
jgi:hypothetical protein